MSTGSDTRLGVLLDAKDNATKTVNNVKNSLNELGKSAQDVTSVSGAFKTLGSTVGLAAAALGAFQLGSAVVELAKVGAQAQRVEDSFRILSQQAGIAADDFLASMQRASQGSIANSELMLTANRALALGVADSSAEISQLLQVAIARGKALGLSATTAFNDLVTGIGRMSPLILDNLGIVTGGEKVFNDYAASIGKSTAALTDHERKQALVNKVIAESRDLVDANARAGRDSAASFERVAASFANIREDLGQLFGPAIAAIAEQIANAVDGIATGAINLGKAFDENEAVGNIELLQAAVNNLKQTSQFDLNILSQISSNDTQGFADQLKKISENGLQLVRLSRELADAKQAYFDKLRQLYPAQEQTADSMNRTSVEAQALAQTSQNSATALSYMEDEARQLGSTFEFLGNRIDFATQRADILRGSVGGLANIASEIVSVSSAASGLSFYESATDELKSQIKIWQEQGYVQEQIANILLPAYQRGVRKAAEETYGFGQAATRASQLAKSELKALNAEFENIKNNASGILTDAINDIGGVDLDSILPREDEVNENARRLADIAVNGFKGQNWLEEFKQEVPDIYQALVESGDPRKTAAQILRDFQDGLRPELLDKGRAKELVKRAIIGDQNLSAIADEIAREVASELGVSLEQAQSAAASALGTSDSKNAEKKITITPTIDRSQLGSQQLDLTARITAFVLAQDIITRIDYAADVTTIKLAEGLALPILAAEMAISKIVIPTEVKPPDVVIAGGMTINDVVLRSDVAIPDVEIVGTVIVTPPDTTPITSQVLLLSSQVTSITLADSVALPILAAQMSINDIVIGDGVQPPVPSIAGGMTITAVLLRSDVELPEVNLTATTTVTPIDVKAIESTVINVPVNLVIPEIDLSATVTIVEPDTAQITDAPLVYSAIVQTATLADNVEIPALAAPLVVSGVTLPTNAEIPSPELTSSMAIDTVSIMPSAVLPTVNLEASANVRPINPLAISALEATPVNLDATVSLPDVDLNSTVTVTPPDTSLITSTILTIPAQVSEVTLAKDAIFPQPASAMMVNEYLIAPGLLPPTPEITTGVKVSTVSLADNVTLPEVTFESTVNVTPPDTSDITATTLVIPAQVNDVTLSSSAVIPQPVSSMTISEYMLASGIVPPVPQITSSVVVDTVTLADNVALPQVPLVPASVGNTAETDTETALFDLQNRLTPMVIPQIDYLSIPVEQLEAAGIWIMTGISTGITTYNIGNAIVTELYKAQTILTEAGVSNGKTWGAGFGSGASEYITAIVATVVSMALQKIGREGTRTGAQ